MSKHEVEFSDPNYRWLAPGRSIVEQAKMLRAEFLYALWRQIRLWHQGRVGLAQLRALDDAALKDIGLHRSGIEAAVRHGGAPKCSGIAPKPPGLKRAFPAKPHLLLQRTG